MPARTTTVTPDLIRAMSKDVTLASLTRGSTVVVWAIMAVVLASALFTEGQAMATRIFLLVLVVVLAVVVVGTTARSARRALTAALPVGSQVTVEALADRVRVTTDRANAEIEYRGFREVKATPVTVLLRHRGSAIATALPRVLLDDADLATMRAGVASVTPR